MTELNTSPDVSWGGVYSLSFKLILWLLHHLQANVLKVKTTENKKNPMLTYNLSKLSTTKSEVSSVINSVILPFQSCIKDDEDMTCAEMFSTPSMLLAEYFLLV